MTFVIPVSLIIKGIDNNGFDEYSCLRLCLIVCGLNEFFFFGQFGLMDYILRIVEYF